MTRERKPFFPKLDTPAKMLSWLRSSDAGRAIIDELAISHKEWLFSTDEGREAQKEVVERHQPDSAVPAVVVFVDELGNIEARGDRERVRVKIVLETPDALANGTRERTIERLGAAYHEAAGGKVIANGFIPTGTKYGARLVPREELDTLWKKMRVLRYLEKLQAVAQRPTSTPRKTPPINTSKPQTWSEL